MQASIIALLLPAVQAACEAARRAQCMSSFRQLEVALHNYHSAVGHFLPAGLGYGWGFSSQHNSGSTIQNLNGLLLLLPYLGKQALYDAYDMNASASNITKSAYGDSKTLGPLAGDVVLSGNAKIVTRRLAVSTAPKMTASCFCPLPALFPHADGRVHTKTKLPRKTSSWEDSD